MQIASVGLQAGQGLFQIYSGYQQGAAADAQGKAQQQLELQQGVVESNAAAVNAAQTAKEGRRDLGNMKAAAAVSGSDAGGSAWDVIAQSAGDIGTDVYNQTERGRLAMASAVSRGAFARVRGRIARANAISQGWQQGIGTLTGAGDKAYGYWGS